MHADGQIGRYHLTQSLGGGGYGTVWLARDPEYGARVAIKVIDARKKPTPAVTERFIRQASVQQHLQHPGILRIFKTGVVNGDIPYYVMEYADRGSLADRISQRSDDEYRFPLTQALSIAIDMAEALAVAHASDVVHGALKPENILFRSSDSPIGLIGEATARSRYPEKLVIADFGASRLPIPRTDEPITPNYLAPERVGVGGGGKSDPREDVFAAAAILFELLTGQHPDVVQVAGGKLVAAVDLPAGTIRDLRPDVPEFIERAILRGLSVDPEDRFVDARAWADALLRPVTEPVQPVAAPPPPEPVFGHSQPVEPEPELTPEPPVPTPEELETEPVSATPEPAFPPGPEPAPAPPPVITPVQRRAAEAAAPATTATTTTTTTRTGGFLETDGYGYGYAVLGGAAAIVFFIAVCTVTLAAVAFFPGDDGDDQQPAIVADVTPTPDADDDEAATEPTAPPAAPEPTEEPEPTEVPGNDDDGEPTDEPEPTAEPEPGPDPLPYDQPAENIGLINVFADSVDDGNAHLWWDEQFTENIQFLSSDEVIIRMPDDQDQAIQLTSHGEFDNLRYHLRFRDDSGRSQTSLGCRVSNAGGYYLVFDAQQETAWLSAFGTEVDEQLAEPVPIDLQLGRNHAHLECVGNEISGWLNGERIVQAEDDRYSAGRIRLGTTFSPEAESRERYSAIFGDLWVERR